MSCDLLKVLIVEDERLVMDLLKGCIDWEEIGFSIVGESSNAVSALELVERLCPDIIFTDICMPVMDGLEFSKRVIEKYPQIRIIVLTGHEDFEYAKKGIKVGIADFLLKPINDDEIRRTLLSIKEKIIKEKTFSVEYDKMKKQLDQNLPYLKEKFLNELLQGGIDSYSIMEKTSYFGVEIKEDSFQVAVIEADNTNTGDKADEELKLINKLRCLEYTKRFFENDSYVNVFFDNSQKVVILCNDDSVDLGECCEIVKSMLINRLKCYICIGIGARHQTIEKIGLSYKEACDALSYSFVVGKNQVISISDVYYTQGTQPGIDNDLINRFSFCLKSGLSEKAEALVETALNEVECGISSMEQARVIACNFIASVMNVLMESGINEKDVLKENSQPFEKIFKIDTLPDIKEYLKRISTSSAQAILSLQGKKARKIIQDVKDYIDNNYTNSNITLSEVAKKFFVNLSYLSRIFKEETGQTFVDYLMKLRMEKAVKMLSETDLKAYQIAENVGINDPHYFSFCFKKYTGISANDYRKSK